MIAVSRFAVAFIVIQTLIPATMLIARWVDEGSVPQSEYVLSFQMYTTAGVHKYVGTDQDGDRRSLSITHLTPFKRATMYGDTVAKMLCEKYPDLVTVERLRDAAVYSC